MLNASTNRSLALLVASASLASASLAHAEDDFFESRIRPVLADNCFECHSESAGTTKGGLALDSRPGWERGGDSGPVIVPGDSGKSLLLDAVRYAHPEVHMPPRGKLPDPAIRDLEAWIAMGAPDPRESPPVDHRPPSLPKVDIEASRSHWAFRRIEDPTPPPVRAEAESWVRDPIDRFVLAKLDAAGLAPAKEADRRTWLRRVTFDLTGLPPTQAELTGFQADTTDGAYANVVDRLLASPAYGERFGRYWLDLVRYSDSNGVDENLAFGYAWRYRDYVVQSFNDDKPFDRFVTEQLAGDLLPEPVADATDPAGSALAAKHLREQIVATGFLVLGPKMLAEQDKEKLVVDTIDEQIDVVGKTFLGATISCARCHDHKFDPFTQRDYYALGGIFRSTTTFDELGFLSRWREREIATRPELAARDAWRTERESANQALATATDHGRKARRTELLRALPRYADAVRPAASEARFVEAEAFTSSNLRIDHESYGTKDVGLIHTQQGGQQFAEYALDVPRAGRYALEIRYASGESRPMRVLANGEVVAERVLADVTGGFKAEHRKTVVAATFDAPAGALVLRLERIPNEPQHVPHLDSLLLHPVTENGEWPGIRANDLEPGIVRAIAEGVTRRPESEAAIARAKDVATALDALPNAEAEKKPLADAELEAARQALLGPNGVLALDTIDAIADESRYAVADREAIVAARATLASIDARKPRDFDRAMAVADDKVAEMPLHIRGSHLNKEPDPQPRATPGVFDPLAKLEPIADGASGRLEIARWICAENNPLTSRVLANRIWLSHFGQGLCRSPSNFGQRGETPSHPELLDWLARELVRGGWSQKALHRRIVLSATYRMASDGSPEAVAADPENRLLAWFPRLRLDAESLRDAILFTAGTLDRTVGGTLLKTNDRDYVTNDQSADNAQYGLPRRTLYLPIIRNAMYDFLATFDYADPSVPLEQRPRSVVASQALWLMNSPIVIEQSLALAKRLRAELVAEAEVSDATLVAAAYRTVLLREPTTLETERGAHFVATAREMLPEIDPKASMDPVAGATRDDRALATFVQALFASSEFLHVD